MRRKQTHKSITSLSVSVAFLSDPPKSHKTPIYSSEACLVWIGSPSVALHGFQWIKIACQSLNFQFSYASFLWYSYAFKFWEKWKGWFCSKFRSYEKIKISINILFYIFNYTWSCIWIFGKPHCFSFSFWLDLIADKKTWPTS